MVYAIPSLLLVAALGASLHGGSTPASRSVAESAYAPPATATASMQPMDKAAGHAATSREHELVAADYVEDEWLLKGDAQIYAPDGNWHQDGNWAIRPEGVPIPYATRLLVRHPRDPARFNGVVVLEWLNTTLGFDLDGGWMLLHDEMTREGYAWVGVSADPESIPALQSIEAARYGVLSLDSKYLSYDIFTQAAKAVRAQATGWTSASGAPHAVKVLGLGYSRSATFLLTYINAFEPVTNALDGFYLRGAAPVGPPSSASGWYKLAPHIRVDTKAPVMQVQTEMEAMVSWALSSTVDTDRVRYWEIAGASHFDRDMQEQTLAVATEDFKSITPRCWKPTDSLPARDFDHAALHGLRMWVTEGTPPPKAPRLQRNALGFVSSDELGNARGGLRLPELDAPLAQYGMFSNMPTNSLSRHAIYACMAGGSANPLGSDTLQTLYKSKQDYLETYQHAADKLMAQGFLRPADRDTLVEQANRARWLKGD